MSFVTEAKINQVRDAILHSREFCGDERTAAFETMADLAIHRADRGRVYRVAKYRANGMWNHYQREAGVPEKYLF